MQSPPHARTAAPILTLQGISKTFAKGATPVLRGVNLTLTRGRVYTLTGGNGSGKTTLLNIISGYLAPDSGTIRLHDRPVTRFVPYRLNRVGIGRTFQDLRLAPTLSVFDNILLALEKGTFTLAHLFARPAAVLLCRATEILEDLSLADRAHAPAAEISYGQQKLLTLGCCIANDADLLLLDEPVAGIDQANRAKITTLITRLKNSGKTILQIEHHPDYIRATTDATLNMQGGILSPC